MVMALVAQLGLAPPQRGRGWGRLHLRMAIVRVLLSSPATVISAGELLVTAPAYWLPSR